MNKQISKQQAETLLKRATTASLGVAITLILIKTWGYAESGSVAILGTLLDSVMDSLSSIIIYAAVRFSMIPADEDHRFGHGKAEAIAGLIQACVIGVTSLLLIYDVADKFIHPQQILKPELGMGVIIVSIFLTIFLVFYQKHVKRQTGSIAIEADAMHYSGDILLNLGVLVALVLGGTYNMIYADPIFGAIAAGYLIYCGYQVFIASTDVLMDKEMDEEERQRIIEIVKSHERVMDIHELRTRRSGLNIFIQFHMGLEEGISLFDAHAISDQVDDKLMNAYPNAEVFIHADPIEVIKNND